MYQQINLYQPIFRHQRQVFSAATLLQAAAVVAVALLVIYGYGRWQLAGLETQATRLEAREKAFTLQLGRVDPSAGRERRKQVEAEVAKLNAELATQQELADVLAKRPLGTREGFSPYLAALGRRHSEGLWLTEVRINGATGAMELAGHSVRADLVPEYLKRLGAEQALTGQRFDHLKIERSDQIGAGAEVAFRVSSRAVGEVDQPGRRPSP